MSKLVRIPTGPQFSLIGGMGETMYHLGSFWSSQAAYAAGRRCGFTNWEVVRDGLTALVPDPASIEPLDLRQPWEVPHV